MKRPPHDNEVLKVSSDSRVEKGWRIIKKATPTPTPKEININKP